MEPCRRWIVPVVAAVLLAAGGSGGAATLPVRPLDAVPGLDARPVEVVAVSAAPETEFRLFAATKTGGGTKGFLEGWAGGAVAGGLAGLFFGLWAAADSGRWEGGVIVPLFGAAVGSVWGAVKGSYKGAEEGRLAEGGAAEIREATAALERAVADFDVGRSVAASLREAVAAARTKPASLPVEEVSEAGSIPSPATAGRVVLEVTPRRVFLDGVSQGPWGDRSGGRPRSPALCIIVAVRVLLPAEGREVHSEEFRYEGPWHPLSDWVASDGALLREELARGSRELGREVVDQLFLPAELPLIPQWAVSPLLCGLSTTSEVGGTDTAPRLSWASFPRPADLEATPGLGKRVSDVRYDLRVWEADLNRPGVLVYEREGLAETTHRVETPLSPRMKYLWTVRARFRLDGRVRVTPWSALAKKSEVVGDRSPGSGWLFKKEVVNYTAACDARGRVTGYFPSFVMPGP